MADVARLIEQLKEFDALRDDDKIKTGTVDRIEPQYADEWPTQLHLPVRDALTTIRPYRHQADAIIKSLSDVDVVMESPTASGKTLAFTAPMLDSLIRNKGSHALMIYPMKALAFDQREQIRNVCEPLGIESWSYDGDTEEQHKNLLRKNPP